MWYIFKTDKCIATCDFEPNQDDLKSRGEKAYESEEYISISEAKIVDEKVKKVLYVPPKQTLEEIKQQRIQELDNEYQPQFLELSRTWANASMDGKTELANSIADDRLALKQEYEQKRGVINNG